MSAAQTASSSFLLNAAPGPGQVLALGANTTNTALDAVWRASELGHAALCTVSSGYAGLDAALPGQGWPRGHLTEVLQHQAGLHEWRLLLPAVRATVQARLNDSLGTGTRTAIRTSTSTTGSGLAVVLIGSPHGVNLSALACQGLPARAVLVVNATQPAERLWAAEQALRCRDVAVLLLWAPQVRADQLRRLQVAAQAAHPDQSPLVFVLRGTLAQHDSSPAPLRVAVQMAAHGQLAVRLLKRRGPPLDAPVHLGANWPAAVAYRDVAARELVDHVEGLDPLDPLHHLDSPDPLGHRSLALAPPFSPPFTSPFGHPLYAVDRPAPRLVAV
jgi:protein ImuA